MQVEMDEAKTQLSTVKDAQVELDTRQAAIFSMTRQRNNGLSHYHDCVERLVLRDDGLRKVISERNALFHYRKFCRRRSRAPVYCS